MRQLLSGIPGLYWVAFVFLGLALWVDDVFGVVIAVMCMVIGTLQLVRAPDASRAGGPDDPADPDSPDWSD